MSEAEKIVKTVFRDSDRKMVAFYEGVVAYIVIDKSFASSEKKAIKERLKAEGVGMFKRISETDRLWDEFLESLEYMEYPILQERFEKSIVIPYDEITKYTLHSREKYDNTELGTLMIKSKSAKFEIFHHYTEERDEFVIAREFLETKAPTAKGSILCI